MTAPAWTIVIFLLTPIILLVVDQLRGQRNLYLVKLSPKKDSVGVVQLIRVLARNKRQALRLALRSIAYSPTSTIILTEVIATVFLEHHKAAVVGMRNVTGKSGWVTTALVPMVVGDTKP